MPVQPGPNTSLLCPKAPILPPRSPRPERPSALPRVPFAGRPALPLQCHLGYGPGHGHCPLSPPLLASVHGSPGRDAQLLWEKGTRLCREGSQLGRSSNLTLSLPLGGDSRSHHPLPLGSEPVPSRYPGAARGGHPVDPTVCMWGPIGNTLLRPVGGATGSGQSVPHQPARPGKAAALPAPRLQHWGGGLGPVLTAAAAQGQKVSVTLVPACPRPWPPCPCLTAVLWPSVLPICCWLLARWHLLTPASSHASASRAWFRTLPQRGQVRRRQR